MANPRTYTDDQLRAAVAASTNWTQVLYALGKAPGDSSKRVKAVAERLGLDTSHFAYKRSFQPVESRALPFQGREQRNNSATGLSIAARWFLDRGYLVSVPLETAPYDLITESDDGLKRIQVKTTSQVSGDSGRYLVRLSRMTRDPGAPMNSNGQRRHVAYTPDEVDYFFVVTSTGTMYLIPIDVVAGQIRVTLDVKFAAFAV